MTDPPTPTGPEVIHLHHGGNRRILEDQSDGTPMSIWLPVEATFSLEHVDVTLTVDASDDTLVVTSVTFRPRPPATELATEHLRIPLGDLRQRVIQLGLAPGMVMPDKSRVYPPPDGSLAPETARLAQLLQTTPRGPGRSHGPNHYRQVAAVYREALDRGEPTQQAVIKAFSPPERRLAKGTAARWIHEARERTDPVTGEPYLGASWGRGAKGER